MPGEIVTELVGLDGYEVADAEYYEWLEPSTAVLRLESTNDDGPWICGDCGQLVDTAYDRTRYPILDLPYGKWKRVYLDVPKVRVNCPDCGVHQQALEFVEWRRGYTNRLKREVQQACRSLRSLVEIAGCYGLSPYQVKTIDRAYLSEELPDPDYDSVRWIGVDEFSLKKNHHYATRVVDLDTRETLWIGEHRTSATLGAFYEEFKAQGGDLNQIEAVCIDDWRPYRSATETHVPHAQIVQDPFHLIRRMNDVIDAVRTRCRREATGDPKDLLKRTKRLCLKAPEELNEAGKDRLERIFGAHPELGTVHMFREDLRRLWDQPNEREGRQWLEHWLHRALESGIEELAECARKLKKKQQEIAAGCSYGLNTSIVEGLNNTTKALKRVAFGFHDHEYFFLKIRALSLGG